MGIVIVGIVQLESEQFPRGTNTIPIFGLFPRFPCSHGSGVMVPLFLSAISKTCLISSLEIFNPFLVNMSAYSSKSRTPSLDQASKITSIHVVFMYFLPVFVSHSKELLHETSLLVRGGSGLKHVGDSSHWGRHSESDMRTSPITLSNCDKVRLKHTWAGGG